MIPRSARLTDDVLADIQGFITSGYGHLSHAAYLFLQFHEAGQAQRWLGRLVPAITSARPWPDRAQRREGEAAGYGEHRVHRRRPRGLGLPPQVLCTFPPEFQEGIASPADRESLETPRKAIRPNGNWAERGRRPSMRS